MDHGMSEGSFLWGKPRKTIPKRKAETSLQKEEKDLGLT
jgi:hypothetical protein